jgi:hypothetical protein
MDSESVDTFLDIALGLGVLNERPNLGHVLDALGLHTARHLRVQERERERRR